MDELVQHIENRIRRLFQKHIELKKHHTKLSQTEQRLMVENEQLVLKHQSVTNLIEHTIVRLKSIEGLT